MPIFEASDVVEMALELEKNGEAFYRTVAKKAPTPDVGELFDRLADAEVQHYQVFKELAQRGWGDGIMPADEWSQYQVYLQATIQSAFFQGEDKALALANQVSDEREALRMAMGFEKETLLFFYDLRDMVSPADRETVARIIAEEKSHLRQLGEMIQSLKENA